MNKLNTTKRREYTRYMPLTEQKKDEMSEISNDRAIIEAEKELNP